MQKKWVNVYELGYVGKQKSVSCEKHILYIYTVQKSNIHCLIDTGVGKVNKKGLNPGKAVFWGHKFYPRDLSWVSKKRIKDINEVVAQECIDTDKVVSAGKFIWLAATTRLYCRHSKSIMIFSSCHCRPLSEPGCWLLITSNTVKRYSQSR